MPAEEESMKGEALNIVKGTREDKDEKREGTEKVWKKQKKKKKKKKKKTDNLKKNT